VLVIATNDRAEALPVGASEPKIEPTDLPRSSDEAAIPMHLHGIVQTANLEEIPPASGNLEIHLRVQGVGPGQPRKVIIPYAILLRDETLDPESIQGHAFDAEVEQDPAARWIISEIRFASRVLRTPD
jgi:hypothetical protein